MAVRTTIGAGAVDDPTKWDGGVAVPGNGDAVTLEHNMTQGAIDFPVGGGFLSLNLLGTGLGGLLTVTGTAQILATTITGLQKLVDTAATNLIIDCTTAATSATAGWTCNSPSAAPTQIIGNVTFGGVALADNGLYIPTGKRLVVTGNLTAYSHHTAKAGILILGTGSLGVTGNVAGYSDTGAGIGINLAVAAGPALVASGAVTGTATGATGNGIESFGAITAAIITGSALLTNKGVYARNGSVLTGAVFGSSGNGGRGVQIADGAGTATVVGNVTGTLPAAAATGSGVYFGYQPALTGNILVTANPTSAWIGFLNTATKLLSSGSNTIQLGDAQEFCPTANVAIAANVKKGVARYTGGTVGTAELSAMGPWPVSSVAVGPYPVGAASVGPYPVV